jgi:NADH-quinone oxidoreductase subunit L
LPPTVGFSSKSLILAYAWSSPTGGYWVWTAGIVGVFLTSIYTFRMLFLAFFGPQKQEPHRTPGLKMKIPLLVLAFFSVAAAALNWPQAWGGASFCLSFLQKALPTAAAENTPLSLASWLEIAAVCVSLLGIPVAWFVTVAAPNPLAQIVRTPTGAALHRLWFDGWKFDWVYDHLFLRPFVWIARKDREDFIDLFYRALASLTENFHYASSLTQTGRVRWYTFGLAMGAVVIVALVLFL